MVTAVPMTLIRTNYINDNDFKEILLIVTKKIKISPNLNMTAYFYSKPNILIYKVFLAYTGVI